MYLLNPKFITYRQSYECECRHLELFILRVRFVKIHLKLQWPTEPNSSSETNTWMKKPDLIIRFTSVSQCISDFQQAIKV